MLEGVAYRLNHQSSLASSTSNHWLRGAACQFGSALRDQEVRLLFLWGAVSASAALAYLVWVKYPRLRIAAAGMFALSLLNYGNEFGGLRWAASHFGLALPK